MTRYIAVIIITILSLVSCSQSTTPKCNSKETLDALSLNLNSEGLEKMYNPTREYTKITTVRIEEDIKSCDCKAIVETKYKNGELKNSKNDLNYVVQRDSIGKISVLAANMGHSY
jgi:PBP1b-binding outer membrane lipoprotein LpoB